ncbi:MAG: hypothetical protein ACO1Q7_04140 [Gemmatimonas sp.]
MQHLETERIAAFDHEAPNADELAHLAACTVCRTERNAFAALNQRSMHLADAPVYPPVPRLTNWESLSARLRAEGLITRDAAQDPDATSEFDAEIVYLNAARETAHVPVSDARFDNIMRAIGKSSNVATDVAAQAAPAASADTAETSVVPIESWWQRARPRSVREVMRVAAAALFFTISGAGLNQIRAERGFTDKGAATTNTAGLDLLSLGSTGFSTVDEATKALTRTEREYNRIAMWLTANDPSSNNADVLRRRLAALDRVIAASLDELQSAPDDRVLELHYRSAYEAREITLDQLRAVLPVGRSIERF